MLKADDSPSLDKNYLPLQIFWHDITLATIFRSYTSLLCHNDCRSTRSNFRARGHQANLDRRLYHSTIVDQILLYAFAIMPNHIHIIVQCSKDKPLKDMMRDLKSNMTRLIVRQLQAERNQEVLNFLRAAVTRPKKQEYKVWDDDYNAKEVFSPEFLKQKIEYIHNNPLQPHWNLENQAEDYIWSSARFYLLNEPALIPVANGKELF